MKAARLVGDGVDFLAKCKRVRLPTGADQRIHEVGANSVIIGFGGKRRFQMKRRLAKLPKLKV